MLERREPRDRGTERLLNDVLAFNRMEIKRMINSGFSYEEALEMMRNTRLMGDKK